MRFVYIQLRLCVAAVLSFPGIWQVFIQVKMVVNGPYNNFGVHFWEIVWILDYIVYFWIDNIHLIPWWSL